VPIRAHAALALAVYGEELAQGSRVAVFGDATLGLAQELVERGARLVHVYDADPARVVEANAHAHDRSIYFARLPEGGDAGVRDGAFDLVMVPDLSACTDAKAVLAVARRVLSAQGAALIASPNPQASASAANDRGGGAVLGYYELYEAVVAQFPSVRMLGQVPFVGYAVAEFAAVDPEPTIDNSLATQREPDWFVALASQRGVRLEPFALVELPAGAFDAPSAPSARTAREPDLEDDAEPLAPVSGTVLVDILEAEREAALEALREQERRASEERGRADQANSALLAVKDELALGRQRAGMLEAELSARENEKRLLAAQLEEVGPLRAQVSALQAAANRAAEEHDQHGRRSAETYQAQAQKVASEYDARAQKLIAEHEARTRETVGAYEAKARDAAAHHEAELRELTRQHEGAAQKLAADYEAQARAAEVAHEQKARDTSGEYAADIARLESQLRELGRETRGLTVEVARRDKLVREIVAAHVTGGAAAPVPADPLPEDGNVPSVSVAPEGSATISRVAADDAATREADLVAARWKIAQLERELNQRR